MRLGFKKSPTDIYLVIGSCVVTLAVAYIIQVNPVISLSVAGSASGYLTVAALFPGRGPPKWGERLAWSFGVGAAEAASIATLFDIGKSENSYRFGILALAVLSLVAGSLAGFRRIRLPVNHRLEGHLGLEISTWKRKSLSYKIASVALGVAISLCLISIFYLSTAVQRPGRFTEFYFLGTYNQNSSYPTHLNISQPGTVFVGIANYEGVLMNYAVSMDILLVQLRYNATTGINDTVEVNRTTLSWSNSTLPSGQNWTQPFTFRINATGLWKVQFLLFKNEDISSAYREVHLFVRVRP